MRIDVKERYTHAAWCEGLTRLNFKLDAKQQIIVIFSTVYVRCHHCLTPARVYWSKMCSHFIFCLNISFSLFLAKDRPDSSEKHTPPLPPSKKDIFNLFREILVGHYTQRNGPFHATDSIDSPFLYHLFVSNQKHWKVSSLYSCDWNVS